MSTDDNWPDHAHDGSPGDEFQSDPRPREPWSDDLQPPAKQGMSTGAKVLIILLCLGGGLMLLCCGGGFYLATQFKGDFKQNDPAAAKATAAEIVAIEISDQFQPSDSFDFEMPFGFMKMKAAIYKPQAGQGNLMLMEMQIANIDMDQQQQEVQFRQQMQQQGFDNRQLLITSSESREFEIRGRKVPFMFAEAKDAQTGAAFRQVSGVFPGKGGAAFLIMQVDEESYDEEATVEMIESIK